MFDYVAVGSFEVTASSTSAQSLNFNADEYFDNTTFVFDDPETVEVETSAFDNIVAFQIVTTGEIVPIDSGNPNSVEVPQNDDLLVVDDFVFGF